MVDEPNPYQPPRSDVIAVTANRPIVLASNWRRLGTFAIDYACFFLCSFCLGIVIALLFGETGIHALEQIPDILMGVVMMLCYYVFFEGLWARTPGKLALGTIVVNDTGGKPTIGQVLGRTLCRFIPFEPLSFFGKRGWHDSVPDTHVVLVSPPAGARPTKLTTW